MVKNKRLLIALIVVTVLTVPRFVLIQVEQSEKKYFDRIPDDLTDWRAMRVHVCDQCVKELKELIDKREAGTSSAAQLFYFPPFIPAEARCPVHSEVALKTVADFDWSVDSDSIEGKPAVPDTLLGLYPRMFREDPSDPRYREIQICPECQKLLSERLVETAGENLDEAKALAEKIVRLEDIDGLDPGVKLFCLVRDLSEFYCPTHAGNRLMETTDIPVYPVVLKALPPDTEYISRMYLGRDRRQRIDMTIVTSGKDRRSIHRPERCLKSQGYKLDDRRVLTVSVPDAKQKKLRVMKLRMKRTVLDPETGKSTEDRLIVFYWYASVEHITESNMRRIAFTAWDRMILGKNYRWSYVLCHSRLASGSAEEEEQAVKGLYTFTQQFFPAVEK